MARLSDLVDLGRYPIDRPGSKAYERLIADLQRELEADGCAVLPGFTHPEGTARLVAEAEAVAGAGLDAGLKARIDRQRERYRRGALLLDVGPG